MNYLQSRKSKIIKLEKIIKFKKIIKSILAVVMISFLTVSCSDNTTDEVLKEVTAKKIINLHAKQSIDYTIEPSIASGEFVKFSFKKGKVVTDDTWDIAFRATTILVNGGESTGIKEEPKRTGNASISLAIGTFSSIVKAPDASRFKQDEKGILALPKSLWYTYNFSDHSINPVAGKVIVVKTIDGNYAKMEILSYYKDMDTSNSADPENSGAQYYTFNYTYNPNTGDKNLQ
ncbi:HmuY family protein [Tenacibaculum piscium]|uniref:HmuY protein n=1 Tax=Tenacibaculum piscium TaxID=1458515 RepID=A0A2H1YFT0_9FLAO|nr:HmuY family protein [Tenacibaculum piscium]MBE7629745.1 hypothetical protein [Tenacibaculum piscium]MBE7671538.1 hypothetical protein [Tenacibaculum piscium]MBE7685385.1 hypothetical protein [Tenacibaculum piscium]SOS74338.1 hypothetical protein TNO020_20014 [Tenacibaculum piscium]